MTFKATNPDSIEFTMEITMPLEKWKKLRDQLRDEWPSWDLRGKIENMVWQAEKEFYPEKQ